MRVGVIGRGFGARVVAPAFEATEGCEVVDVVSARDMAAVSALCRRSDVDLVSVHSPPFLHVEHVRLAVEARHDVLCDKPFGRNAEEAAEMRAIASDAGVLHFLNFENRYNVLWPLLRRVIADGLIGKPQHVSITIFMSTSRTPIRPYGWMFDAAAGGGWLGAMGSHLIDFTRWTFGEITEIHGQLQRAVVERPDADGKLVPCSAEDGFTLTMRTDEGVTIAMSSSSAAPVNLPVSLLVVGSEGIVEERADQLVVHQPDGDRELFNADSGTNSSFAAQLRYAVVLRDAVHARRVPADVPTFDDGLACAVVMDQVRAS